MSLSILIPFHNEGVDFIQEAIRSIKETVDVEYEVIIADDCSEEALVLEEEYVTVVRQKSHLGVGQAFNLAASHAKYDNLWLQGNDIRFAHNNWASKMISAVDENPKSVICTICVGLNTDAPINMDIEHRRKRSRRNGSTILFYHDHLTHPKKHPTFKNILECQWLPMVQTTGLVEIPAVLGAAYIVKREWYNHMDGWWGHRSWGTLEPYISLKSWLMGGNCLCNHDVDTGHIFKGRVSPHGTPHHHLTYNKLLTATLLLPEDLATTMIDYLGENPQLDESKKMFNQVKDSIFAKREEYREKIVYHVREYCQKFNIELRE